MTPDEILEGLNAEQRDVAESLLGPVRVLAGAGTGKTTAITRRIAYGIASGVYDPHAVMALTFTNRAAAELRARLAHLGVPMVAARTFHAAALAQLRHFWSQVFEGYPPSILDAKLPLVLDAARSRAIDVSPAQARDIAKKIEWRKVRNLAIDDFLQLSDRSETSGLTTEAVGLVMREYEHLKLRAHTMDMEDVLLALLGVLENEPTVASQVRTLYRVFVVDEYQDISPVQQRLLEVWLGNRRDVCVVGDAAQTIYSFAGASARFLLDFPQTFPGAKTIEMVENYRSTREIVRAANTVIRGEPGAVALRSQRSGNQLRVVELRDRDEELGWIAQDIAARIQSGQTPETVAVLARVGAQLDDLQTVLDRYEVRYQVKSMVPFFLRAEVSQAMLMLNAQAAQAQSDSPYIHQVADVLRSVGWSLRPPEDRDERQRWESLQALMTVAEGMPPGSRLEDLVHELESRRARQADPPIPGVVLSTIHAAKGLEWDTVYVAHVADGVIPYATASSAAEIAEERRLLYVAMTRARSELVLTWARRDGHGHARRRSPFLAGLTSAR